jgi:hypothetical protein
MKLHSSTHVVEKSGNFEENQFSIEASAKAFMILSDGLYSNKILAVMWQIVLLKFICPPVLSHTSMFVTMARA